MRPITDDATVVSYAGTQMVSSLKGRKQIGDTFAAYLSTFEVPPLAGRR